MTSFDIEHMRGPDEDYISVAATYEGEPTGAAVVIPMSLAFMVAKQIAAICLHNPPTPKGQ